MTRGRTRAIGDARIGQTGLVLTFALDGGYSLRLAEEADVTELHALIAANREYLAQWLPWARAQTPEQTLDFIRATRRQLDRNDGFQTAIVDDQGRIVGMIGFHGISWQDRSTTIGYWLAGGRAGPRHHDRGGLEARRLCVLGPEAQPRRDPAAVGNARSRAIPERLGFVAEGTLREAERVGERYLDSVVYAMLARDWRRRDQDER